METSYKKSLIAERAFEFAIAVIKMSRFLPKTYEIIIFIKQIIRSVTSIGANIEEALGSNTNKEFVHCMNIAKKEARETLYWLKLIKRVNISSVSNIDSLLQENIELINILTKKVKTSSQHD